MRDKIKKMLTEVTNKNSSRDKTILSIIGEYDVLKKGLKFVIDNNKSNYAPYHNLNHLLTVVKYSYNALEALKMLNDDNVEELLLSALFHDFNHSMGKFKDDINIKEAKKGLKKFVEDNEIKMDLDMMNSIIDSTQYPYVMEDSELNIYQEIIRDADMCQVFEYDWLKQNIMGLISEIGVSIDEFLVNQEKFLRGLKFYTSYGKELYKNNIKGIMDDFDVLKSVIK